MSKEAKKKVS